MDIGPGTCETGLIKLLTIDYRSWLLHHVRAPGFQRPPSSVAGAAPGARSLTAAALSRAFEIILQSVNDNNNTPSPKT